MIFLGLLVHGIGPGVGKQAVPVALFSVAKYLAPLIDCKMRGNRTLSSLHLLLNPELH
jgi:hypothetical protein